MIKVIQAPEAWPISDKYTKVFLAGGITNCDNWQDKVIKEIIKLDDELTLPPIAIYNPRQTAEMTDIDPVKQIKWEHEYLNECDILSFFFCASESVQPITLYEFGKYFGRKPSVATVEKGYKREKDVLVQTYLDNLWVNYLDKNNAIKEHVRGIAFAAIGTRGYV